MLGSGFSMGVLVMGLSVGLLMVFFRWVFGLGLDLGLQVGLGVVLVNVFGFGAR